MGSQGMPCQLPVNFEKFASFRLHLVMRWRERTDSHSEHTIVGCSRTGCTQESLALLLLL